MRLLAWVLVPSLSLAGLACERGATIRIGSKGFTESVILGEIARHVIADEGIRVEHEDQLGGSSLLFNALRNGEIDAYPEYTGTLRLELLSVYGLESDAELVVALEKIGLQMTEPLGFVKNYELGMKAEVADRLGITRISDLRRHADLVLRFSNEFVKREDGWPGLRAHYGLVHRDVAGVDHDIAYRGLESGAIAVTDLYSTDAELERHDVRRLEDDLGYFPSYRAVYVLREDLATREPRAVAALRALEARIGEKAMRAMNARVEHEHVGEPQVAAEFMHDVLGIDTEIVLETAFGEFLRHTLQHLFLVAVSLSAAIFVSMPLGVLAAKKPRVGRWILRVVGALQTVPSLALLALMVSLLRLPIGWIPAVAALFVYSLLPIVRNTCTGLTEIPRGIRESAIALGLPPFARLRLVELPIALPTILAGIKISAVWNVGTATLGALIGAGGFGDPILTGLRRQDDSLVLTGALAAAVMALAIQGLFDLCERLAVSKGLRA